MAPPGDVLPPSSLWLEGAAVAEDVLGIGGMCGFQGLNLSGAAVATNKEVRRPVKGRAGNKDEVIKGEAEAGCFKPVAIADVEEAPATGDGIKGEAETGCFKPVAVADVEEAPATGGGIKGKVETGCFKPVAVTDVEEAPATGGGIKGKVEAPKEKGKRQVALTPYEIAWILAREPCPIDPPEDREALLKVYPPEMVDGVVETRRVVDQAMVFMNQMLLDLQDSVRKDLAEAGVVMVDDSGDDAEEEEEVALES